MLPSPPFTRGSQKTTIERQHAATTDVFPRGFKATDATGVSAVTELTDVTRIRHWETHISLGVGAPPKAPSIAVSWTDLYSYLFTTVGLYHNSVYITVITPVTLLQG